MIRIEIDHKERLYKAAEAVLGALGGRNVVAFYGEMGAGKTTLIREIAELAGSRDTVTSPTFSIVNQYCTPSGDTLYHFDFYRIEHPAEAFDFGYEEYFDSGSLCLVEWPEKIEALLPDDTMRVRVSVTGPESRLFEID